MSRDLVIGALEAAVGGLEYGEPGGWLDVIERSIVVGETVDLDTIEVCTNVETVTSGVEGDVPELASVAATPVTPKPAVLKAKRCLFITDVVAYI